VSARLAQDVNDARIALLIAEDRALRLRRETARQEAEVAEAEAALRDAQRRLADEARYQRLRSSRPADAVE